MAYKELPHISAKKAAGDRVEFTVKFESTGSVLDILQIKQDGVIIAIDSGVAEETYELPQGIYVAALQFRGDTGTEGTQTITTPTNVRGPKSAKINAPRKRATVSLNFEL